LHFGFHTLGYILGGKEELITSNVVAKEIASAPEKIRELYEGMPEDCKRTLPLTQEVEDLTEAYLCAGVVSRRWREDCQHVALATLAGADAIVSWNFKHLVRVDRIRGFNAINVAEGHAIMQIVSPKEVNLDDD